MVISHSKGESRRSTVRCDGCLAELRGFPWIRCVECAADLCPSCCFHSPQVNDHAHAHGYRVVKSLSFEVTSRTWTLLEEFLFVDALVIHGLGNWEDMATYIGGKSPEEVRGHFFEVYGLEDQRGLEGEAEVGLQSNPLSKEIAGYMPLRQDFETEYENEGESAIKDLAYLKEDTPLEREMKEAMVHSYFGTLRNRELYKFLVFKRGLLGIKRLQGIEKELCKEGRALLSSIKGLIKAVEKEEFNCMFRGLYVEMKLKEKVREMVEARRGQRKAVGENRGDLLSEKEKEVCRKINISDEAYTSVKRMVVSASVKGGMRKGQVKSISKMDDARASTLYGFFSRSGWLDVTHG
jgi:transcriptional adapter 2-alpha